VTRVISLINQHAGVGKTTTAINLSHALALAGNRVALIDLDPANTVAAQLAVDNAPDGIAQVLAEQKQIEEVVIRLSDNLDLITAGEHLADFEQVAGGLQRAFKLKQHLQTGLLQEHDFVLLNGPTGNGLLTINTLVASNELLLPLSCDFSALQGAARVLLLLKKLEQLVGTELRVWFATTRLQLQTKLNGQVRQLLIDSFPGRVLASGIRESVVVHQAVQSANSIFDYQQQSDGAEDYQALAHDLTFGRTG
jgi:chromosome partitioning protein